VRTIKYRQVPKELFGDLLLLGKDVLDVTLDIVKYDPNIKQYI